MVVPIAPSMMAMRSSSSFFSGWDMAIDFLSVFG